MSLTTTNLFGVTNTTAAGIYQRREQFAAAALTGVTGTASVILDGGTTLTGTLDTGDIGTPNQDVGPTRGGWITLTDSGSVVWLIPLSSIVALGQ